MTERDRESADEELRAALLEAGASFEFLQAVRILELYWHHLGEGEAVGTSRTTETERIRFRHQPTLAFHGHEVADVYAARDGRDEVSSRFFGLLGPGGALPKHITELALPGRDGRRSPIAAFLDLFHHRYIATFYRAWASGDPARTIGIEPERVHHLVGSLFGFGIPAVRAQDPIEFAKRAAFAHFYAMGTRCREGLSTMLAAFLDERVQIDEFLPEWLSIPPDQRCALGAMNAGSRLGMGATLGTQSYQCQYRIRIILGPLSGDSLDRYSRFGAGLGGSRLEAIGNFVRGYLGDAVSWTLVFAVCKSEVPQTRLGQGTTLGWNSWIAPNGKSDRTDTSVRREQLFDC